MKKLYMKSIGATKFFLVTGFLIGSLLFSGISFGQTYFSRFPDPTGKYEVTSPSGSGCTAMDIVNPEYFADIDGDTYASFSANISAPYTCSQPYYTFKTSLNLPSNIKTLDPGFQPAFKIRIPTGISMDSLGKYISINTYLNGVMQESKSGNKILARDFGQGGVNLYVYCTVSKSYDQLELMVNSAIIQLNKNFEFDVFHAFGSTEITLPAEISDLKASAAGNNVTVSWLSLTETNVSNYTIQRSSNGGAAYSSVASVTAKGSSSTAASYSYTDKVSVDGNYLYRIITNDKDGSSKATSALIVVIAGQSKLLIFPSVVKSGQNVTIRTSVTGMITIQLYDAQGRLVKQQRTNSDGQASVVTTGLTAGTYNIKIVTSSGSVLQSKVIVN